jgi:hypothetical protein
VNWASVFDRTHVARDIRERYGRTWNGEGPFAHQRGKEGKHDSRSLSGPSVFFVQLKPLLALVLNGWSRG